MDSHEGAMEEIKEHFEELAPRYDWYKKRAWYYYDWLKKIIAWNIPDVRHQRVLELGCGTGDVLAFLNPQGGLGIDISEKMIAIAKKKHGSRRQLRFAVGAGETLKVKGRFDVIILPDVIEHLADVHKTFEQLSALATNQTRILITMINPLWEPILMMGEKLGKKMPEGPHNRISYRALKKLWHSLGFEVTMHKFYVAIPVHIPFLSEPVNRIFYRLPLVQRLGLIELIEIKKRSR